MAVNLFSSIIVFIVSMAINFLLTPFILKSLGNEAYGFVGLSNTIVSYASVVTIALNSMCGRFVAIEWHRGDKDTANIYYSSVIATNIIFSVVIIISSIIFILNLDSFLDIPKELKRDISLTFLFYFINFCIGLFNGVFSVGIFVQNKLYLISIRNAISSLILATFIVLLFYFFKPLIAYIAISALIASTFVFFSTIVIVKKIAPQLKFRLKNYSFNHIKTLIKSGIFNSFNALNRILLTGMDLFICNIFLGANLTGLLAVSKAAPIIAESFVAQISSVFAPKFIELYSKQKLYDLIEEIKFAMRIVSFIVIAPISIFIVFGVEFYTLWLHFKPQDEIKLIYEISIITLVPILLISQVFVLFNLDTTTNKLIRPAIANTILGFVTISAQIYILKYTNYGVYGMVIIGSILYSLRIAIFDPINAALNLNLKITTFIKTFIHTLIVFFIVLCLMYLGKYYLNFNIQNWLDFLLASILFGVFGYIISLFLLFSTKEINSIKDIIKAKSKGTR